MASTNNFDKDLAFRQSQLNQQAIEAAALSTYRLYRTQLVERGMMALEADKAAREMALQVAQTAYQQQMGRVQAVMNAPRGPGDWAAYANRLRGLQQSGEMPGVLGTLALPGRTALNSNGGQAPPVPLTNTQMADAATMGLSGGTAAAPALAGPAYATNRLASAPYAVPDAFPAYFANPTAIPTGAFPAPRTQPVGYGSAPAAIAGVQGGLSAQVMPQTSQQRAMTGSTPAADMFVPTGEADYDQWYRDMLGQMQPGAYDYGNQADVAMPDDNEPVPGTNMTKRQARMAARQSRRVARNGYPAAPQPQRPQAPANQQPQNYYSGSPYGSQQAPAANLFAAVQPQGVSAAAATPYAGPTAADPNVRGLYGSDLSYQRFRNLSPAEQEMTTGYAEEGLGGFEPQSKDDFLSGMIKAAPNFAPARQGTWAGMR